MMKLLPLLQLLQIFLQFAALVAVDVNTTGYVVRHLGTSNKVGSSPSPWIKGVMNQEWHRRRRGCRHRPWVCNPEGERGRRRRRKCCRNRCIDVYSDVNHCGFCRRRCPFGWSCCARRCVDTRFSRRNCGRCFNRCPRRTTCYMGMCGYADEFSPNMEQPQPQPQPDKLSAQLNATAKPDILNDDLQQPPAASG